MDEEDHVERAHTANQLAQNSKLPYVGNCNDQQQVIEERERLTADPKSIQRKKSKLLKLEPA